MTIPKATTITYATMPQEGERISIKGHDVMTDGIYVAGISHSATIEPFKFQSESDSNLDLLLYGRPVNLTSDDGKCEHVPLSTVTSYADTTESMEDRYSNDPLITNAYTVDVDVVGYYDISNWILNNRKLVEDILKEGEK
jgi:hypothetical protein